VEVEAVLVQLGCQMLTLRITSEVRSYETHGGEKEKNAFPD
jgi:hypothetical protein